MTHQAHISEMTLSNGTRLLLVPSSINRLVACSVFFPSGTAAETADIAGLTDFTLRSMLRGTSRRNQQEFAEAVESLGSSVEFRAHRDFSSVSFVCTSDCLEATLELVAEALTVPTFDPAEIEKERASTLAAIREELDEKSSFAAREFCRVLFSGSTYGIPVLGTEESVASFTREQILECYDKTIDLTNSLVVAVGHFEVDHFVGLLEGTFGQASARGAAARPPIVACYNKGMLVEMRRQWEQAYLMLGFPACPISHRDYFPLRLLAGVLGDGMSSRFFVRLRDERGLAYATGCQLAAFRCGGYLAGFIGTKAATLDEARESMLTLFSELCQDLVPDDELERTKNYLVGKYLIGHQRNAARAFYLGAYEMAGLGWRFDEEYAMRLRAVRAEDVLEVARQYLDKPLIVQIRPFESGPSQTS